MKDITGNYYIPSFGINTIGNIDLGYGYKVKMNAVDTLYYPGN